MRAAPALPLRFEVVGLRLGTGGNDRGHWRTAWRKARAIAKQVSDVGQARGVHFLGAASLPLEVTITRVSTGTRLPDDDNAIASAKPVRDAIARMVGVDDGDPRWSWIVKRERARYWSVRIEIKPGASHGQA